jgi:hypothetical protein
MIGMKPMKRVSSRLSVATVAALLTGCSPYLYETEIKGFRDGLTALRSSVTEASAANTSNWRDLEAVDLRSRASARRSTVEITAACDGALRQVRSALGLTPRPTMDCDIVSHSLGRESVTANIYPTEEAFAKSAALLQALQDYGDALAAITDARDSKALQDAASGVCTAVAGIAAAAAIVPAAVFGPACSLASVGLVLAMNQARYDVLLAAVRRVDAEVMPLAQTFLGQQLTETTRQRLIAIGSLIRSDTNLLNDTSAQASGRATVPERTTRRLIDNVATARALLRADPAGAATAMATAHGKLLEALNDQSRQSLAVAQAVAEFLAAVVKLRDAYSAANA